MIPLTTVTISGMIGFVALLCTIIFGIFIKKGPVYFKLHKIFSIVTLVFILIHVGLLIRGFF